MALSKEDILKGSVVCDRVTGVYFLIHGDEIVYVGQSVDVFSRFEVHRVSGKVFDRVYYIECEEWELSDVEAEYIIKFAPKYNRTVPGNNRWCSLSVIKKVMYTTIPELKRYIKKHNIVCNNGYYRLEDFANFEPSVIRCD